MGEHFLLVDDEDVVRRSLARLIRPHGESTVAATVEEAGRLLVSRSDWCGFILDVGLPDGSGLDLLERVRKTHPLTPVLVLSARCEPDLVNRAYDLWAEYVVKPACVDRLRRFAGLAAARGGRASPRARLERVIHAKAGSFGLTGSEADMLRRSALGQSRDEIARARSSSDLTVKTQITSMLAKTGYACLTAAVASVLHEVAES